VSNKSSSIKQYARGQLGAAHRDDQLPHTRPRGEQGAWSTCRSCGRRWRPPTTATSMCSKTCWETFVDRGQLERFAAADRLAEAGGGTPGPEARTTPRLLAVLQALDVLRPAGGSGPLPDDRPACDGGRVAGQDAGELHPGPIAVRPWGSCVARGLVERVVGTQSYLLPSQGYRIAVLYLKLFHRIYAPLTAGIMEPVSWDDKSSAQSGVALLDRLYAALEARPKPTVRVRRPTVGRLKTGRRQRSGNVLQKT